MLSMIDAHIHFDQYSDQDIHDIIEENKRCGVEAVITVSTDKASGKRNLQLSHMYSSVYPAFGFHPEQPLPTEEECYALLSWMEENRHHMIAVGEVGLPSYLRQQQAVDVSAYRELLTVFIQKAARWNLPVVLHAVDDDADIACNLLEAYSIKRAHFHWFKGNNKTVQRLAANGYHISFTPDICYKPKRKHLMQNYPLELIMVETDGPWPFAGPFKGEQTRPKLIHRSLETLANVRRMGLNELCEMIYQNTRAFYQL